MARTTLLVLVLALSLSLAAAGDPEASPVPKRGGKGKKKGVVASAADEELRVKIMAAIESQRQKDAANAPVVSEVVEEAGAVLLANSDGDVSTMGARAGGRRRAQGAVPRTRSLRPCRCLRFPCRPGFCEDDIDRFCKKVEPGEGRLAACLTEQLAEETTGNEEGEPAGRAEAGRGSAQDTGARRVPGGGRPPRARNAPGTLTTPRWQCAGPSLPSLRAPGAAG